MHGHCSRLSSAARVGAAIGCCGLLLLAGCSRDPLAERGKRVTVTGKVTLDGQPLTGGAVFFYPIFDKDNHLPSQGDLLSSVCELGDDGSFTLRTAGKPGAPLGKYRVKLEAGEKSDRQQWAKLPGPFRRSNSPLEVEVVENKSEGYDLNLSSKDRPRINRMKRMQEKKEAISGSKKVEQ